jgi:radical SAM-linked protein
VHHTNLDDARADERKLVCYHCGVACDLTAMRDERIGFLEKMGAVTRPVRKEGDSLRERAQERVARGLAPHDFSQGSPVRYRLKYGKTGPMSLRGHLDFIRVLNRVMRRAALPLRYTEGFSPRPLLSFGPALGLGISSVAEYADVSLSVDLEVDEVMRRIRDAAEPGLSLFAARRLSEGEPPLSRRIDAIDYLVFLPEAASESYLDRVKAFRTARSVPVEVRRKGRSRTIDAKSILIDCELRNGDSPALPDSVPSEGPALALRVKEASGVATLRPSELAEAILGLALPPHAFLRTACWSAPRASVLVDPLEDQGVGIEPDSRTLIAAR